MKRQFLLLCLITIFVSFAGCSVKTEESPATSSETQTNSEVLAPEKNIQTKEWDETSLLPGIQKIIQKGTLTVAMVQEDLELFCETQEDGTLTGIDVELAQNLANSLGVSLTINRSSTTHNELTNLLASDETDLVIATYSSTTDRAAYVNLSEPYMTIRLGVMVNKQELVKNQIEKNPIDYMKNNPIKLAAIRSSAHVTMIRELFPNAEIVEKDSYEELSQAVRNNEIFGYLCGEAQFLFDYILDPELSLYTQVFVFSDALDQFCVGVSPQNPDLLNFVNTYIRASVPLTIKDIEEKSKETMDK